LECLTNYIVASECGSSSNCDGSLLEVCPFERSVRRNPGPSGAGQDELSQLGRKASLDASHPQTDEESPPLQGGVLQQKAFIDDIIAEIELPRGLVLTPQQISDLKQTLYPAGSDIELITSKITEFLEPIYSALFLSKFNL